MKLYRKSLLRCIGITSLTSIKDMRWYCFQGGSVVNNSLANAGDTGDLNSILGSRKSPGEGNGNSLEYFLPGKFHGQRSLVGYSPWGR